MRKVVIVGSTGQLAADLLHVFGNAALGLRHDDIEVRDANAVSRKLRELQPSWVINTASYNRVDDSESNPDVAFGVNAIGAHHVSRAAADVGAGIVYFSSDYVFGEQERRRGQPYMENDPTAPVNVYGASKCAGEALVRLSTPRHLIIRTAGLYGHTRSRKGSTFPETLLQKARTEKAVQVVDDQVVSPTFSLDLAHVVKQLLDRNACGVFHVANSGECSWFEFTRELFALAGVSTELIKINSAQSQRPACRPAYSALASTRLAGVGITPLRPWQDALRAYLKVR
jgi:dTDP-4-dehydrorhamnose reductase